MNPQRYQQVKKLFLAACELDEDRVAAFLEQECADDVPLREEVESLLRHHWTTTIIGEPPEDTPEGKILRPVPKRFLEAEAARDGAATKRVGEEERFSPGTVIAGRYRILGLLGRGGMGEVYRADDLKLNQPVALKFLSRLRTHDAAWLARFHNEVRLARRVTHLNVNRVYDIGEANGEAFISMEYVDGEDLASLLRRIGRLPGDKAVEIARQLCAGLRAAHDRGVLHRDLKPANVMIDGRGQVRITDFGIASLVTKASAEGPLAGTPAFMAPELFQGKEPSVRTDIFSLGVVLYEMVTGHAPSEGVSADRRGQQGALPNLAPLLSGDVDPALGRVIAQCLERDPRRRPDSTYTIAAALPGVDPLTAALAAGETPSPSMVAAAGTGILLGHKPALACLAVALCGLMAVVLLADRTLLLPQAGLRKPPTVLADKAEGIIRTLGHASGPAGSMQGFAIDRDYLRYVLASEDRAAHWKNLSSGRPPAILFWYRQGDSRLVPPAPFGEPALRRKLPAEPGMDTVRLDGQGNLLRFLAVPLRSQGPPLKDEPPDWKELFDMAGLDIGKFDEIAPVRDPPVYADRIVAWKGIYPANPEVPIRIEGASLGGRVVYFDVVPPWRTTDQFVGGITSGSREVSRTFVVRFALYMAALAGAVLLARRNLRLGRGDLRGARRLAMFVFLLGLADWVIGQRHVAIFVEEAASCYLGMARATLAAAGMWLSYIAAEPYVRRLWPHTMITWCRVLKGRFRDPVVGRDILFGSAFGIGLVLTLQVGTMLPTWLGLPEPVPRLPRAGFDLTALFGIRYKLGTAINMLLMSISFGLVILLIMLLLRVVLKAPRLAAVVFCVLLTIIFSVVTGCDASFPWATGAILAMGTLLMLTRVGLVAVILGWFVSSLILIAPITSNLTAWYAPASNCTVIFVAVLLGYGYFASSAARRVHRF